MIIDKKIKKNRGMTYVELIVVMSIFASVTSVVVFNYGKFQAKVDIKNLANDIALKIVEAQKSAMSGKLQSVAFASKPAYGLYFNKTTVPKKFVSFADLDNSNTCDVSCDSPYTTTGERLDIIDITKGNFIDKLWIHLASGTLLPPVNDLTITFKRPNSGPVVTQGGSVLPFDYIKIDIASPVSGSIPATITVYASGRIQIN